MTSNVPSRINQRWIDSKIQSLSLTRKEFEDGNLNPNYVQLQSEIEQAEEEKRRWDAFADWVLRKLEAKVNIYPVKTTSGRLDAGTCFYSKNQNKVWSFEVAWALYESEKKDEASE